MYYIIACMATHIQVDMRAMKEVNINWKMLTNLRPGNKADEIFFAQ